MLKFVENSEKLSLCSVYDLVKDEEFRIRLTINLFMLHHGYNTPPVGCLYSLSDSHICKKIRCKLEIMGQKHVTAGYELLPMGWLDYNNSQ